MLQLFAFQVVFLVFMGLCYLAGGLLGVQLHGVRIMPVLCSRHFCCYLRGWAHFHWIGFVQLIFWWELAQCNFDAGSRDEPWRLAFPSPRAWCALVPYRRLVESCVRCRDVDVASGLGFLRVIRILALLRCRAGAGGSSCMLAR